MKQQLFIPDIGNKIKLEQDWQFTLHPEGRNSKLYEHFSGEVFAWRTSQKQLHVTLPKGTTLVVDRIYIRKGISEYSSLSFFVHAPDKPYNKARFWASLTDCNKIYYSLVSDKVPVKLFYNMNFIESGERLNRWGRFGVPPLGVRINQEITVYQVMTAKETVPRFKVTNSYIAEEVSTNYDRYNFLGIKTVHAALDYYARKVENILYDLQGNEIGTYKNKAAVVKAMKEILENDNK